MSTVWTVSPSLRAKSSVYRAIPLDARGPANGLSTSNPRAFAGQSHEVDMAWRKEIRHNVKFTRNTTNLSLLLAFHFCFFGGISWLSIPSGFGFSIIKHTGLVVYRPVTGLGVGIFIGGVS
jgi:hypothetical protein